MLKRLFKTTLTLSASVGLLTASLHGCTPDTPGDSGNNAVEAGSSTTAGDEDSTANETPAPDSDTASTPTDSTTTTPESNTSEPTESGTPTEENSSEETSSETTETETEDPPAETSTTGWRLSQANPPCVDKAAMWWDNTSKGFWGCGKRGDPGFYSTADGGQTWQTQRPFGGVLVQGITRAPDGTLYVSGKAGNSPVVRVDERDSSKMDYTELYQRGTNAFTSVGQGEHVAVTDDGQILIDSLTGTNAAYHPGRNEKGKGWFANNCTGDDPSVFNPDSTGAWCELHGVGEETLADPEAPAYQITALQAVNNRFYATGRKIDTPPQVRLPSKETGATYHFHTVTLTQKSSEIGEMLDMYVWKSGQMITVGTDQTSGAYLPLIYLCEADKDCHDTANWEDIELDEFDFKYDDSARDGRAVDANGSHIVVVGNFVPNSLGGWAVESKDGGKTWKDLTPMLAPLTENNRVKQLFDVKVFADGSVRLFGQDNFEYTP